MSEFKAAGFKGRLPGLFMGQKQPSGDVGEITDFGDGIKITSVGALVSFKKRIETSNYLKVHRVIGWALNYFLDQFGKHLWDLKSFQIEHFGNGVEVNAEWFFSGLTKEDDYEGWFLNLLDVYREAPTMCGGYQYWPRGTTWDKVEVIGEIEIGDK